LVFFFFYLPTVHSGFYCIVIEFGRLRKLRIFSILFPIGENVRGGGVDTTIPFDGSAFSVLIMQKYKMQTFPRARWGIAFAVWWIGYIATVCATVLLHKSTQVCATKYVCTYVYRGFQLLYSPLCLSVCLSVSICNFFIGSNPLPPRTHTHRYACGPLAGFSFLPGCKPLENCIFISIVYLLHHLFAFDLPSTTENSTAENTNCKHQRQTAGVLSKVLQKSLFHQMKLENLIFTFGVICLAQNIGFQTRVNRNYTVKIYF